MPSNAPYEQAMLLFKNEKYTEALHFFHLAVELEPENADLLNDRGVCFFHLKRKEEALADLDRALKLQPKRSYRYSARAYLRDRMGDTSGAVEDYRTAVDLDPEDAIALNNLGLLEEKLGHIEKAKRRFKRADELAEQKGLYELYQKDQPQNESAGSENEIGVRKVDGSTTENSVEATPANPAKLVNKDDNPGEQPSTAGAHFKVMLNVFRQKDAFRDFVRFVKRGFRNDAES